MQLVGVLVLAVVILLRFDGRVHPLLLHLGPRQVEIGVGLVVGVQGALRGPEGLLVLLLGLGQQVQRRRELRLDPLPFAQMLKNTRISLQTPESRCSYVKQRSATMTDKMFAQTLERGRVKELVVKRLFFEIHEF